MDDEIQLISDGEGLAVIGDPKAVESFLTSEGLSSTDLGLHRLGGAFGNAAKVAQAGSDIAANSGRWVKLTKESAESINKIGAMKGSSKGLSRGIIQARNGKIKGIVQFEKTTGSVVTNPAMLAGAAGIMAQVAMEQSMKEITDYLAVMDEKVDDILRAQKDAALAEMIGTEMIIAEAMTIRGQVGRVSDVTWSKVESTPMAIAVTQSYALRQLDGLAEKLEKKAGIEDLAVTAKNARATVKEWLAVLARCFQLQDAIAVLELDRVLDSSPEDLDRHRLGLQEARRKRLDLISRSTGHLLERMSASAMEGRENRNVLQHPKRSGIVVEASNDVAADVIAFYDPLGIDSDHRTLESKRWLQAATEAKDEVIGVGADSVGAVKDFGANTFNRAKSTKNRLAIGIKAFQQAVKGDNQNVSYPENHKDQ